jgi:hypothetical protein
MATVLTETKHAGSCIISEEDNFHCRDAVTVAEQQTLLPNQVVGIVGTKEGAITVGAPVFTGTGNGTLTMATPAYGAGAQPGTYSWRLVEAGANSGQFEVHRPDGTLDGYATVGTPYDGQVKGTINDGTVDFTANAQFTNAVTIGEAVDVSRVKAFNPAASDGAEIAAAIMIYGVTTGAGKTAAATAWTRGPAQVRGSDLVWAAGTTDPQKLVGIGQLAKLGIIVRP